MTFLRKLIVLAALSLAFAAPASAQEATTLVATHGDWEIRCAPAPNEICVMSQSFSDAEGRAIALVKIVRFENRALSNGAKIPGQLEVVVPLGVVLTEGLSVQVDSGKARIAPYRFCTKVGCRVLEPIAEDFIAQLKAGASAKVGFRSLDGQNHDATISLKGFTKAFDSLKPAG